MSVATSSYAAHPYAAASTAPAHARRASRRASLPPPPRDPLPPVPTMPGYAAVPRAAAVPAAYTTDYGYGYDASRAAPLPTYARHDRPGGAARATKADRTREWVSTRRTEDVAPAPSNSLAAFGYAIDLGAAPPSYDDTGRSARVPARDEAESAMALSLARSLAAENKAVARRPKTEKPAPAAKAAKSVFRMFGRAEPTAEPGYTPLGDGERIMNTRR